MTEYLKVTIPCPPELHEVLIAELGAVHYDSFQELENDLEAYIEEGKFHEDTLVSILKRYKVGVGYSFEKLPNINWNQEWEKNFEPVHVDGEVLIRATFHDPKPEFKYDIIVNPKMSFGTGHHETTYLMVAEQLKTDFKNKSFLDVGTGTGILAIMAQKKGAKSITATDIDDWCISNSKENFELNGIDNYRLLQGTIDKLTFPDPFDIIFANINKNVLLIELSTYSSLLAKDGVLMISGFYETDIDDLVAKASENQLELHEVNTRNKWAMISFRRANI